MKGIMLYGKLSEKFKSNVLNAEANKLMMGREKRSG
jgi:hypothetical protein